MSSLPVVSTRPANPHLDRLGGPAAVTRLVDAFYAAMDRLPEARTIRAMHEPDLSPTKAVLVMYLTEWLGGERQYSARRGPPRLGRVHAPFHIDAAAAQAWMACMRAALAEVCEDAVLRAELDAAFDKVARHLIRHGPAAVAQPAPFPPPHRSLP